MQSGYENIKAEGAELIAISGDTQFGAGLTRDDLQITFPLLSDSDLQTVSDYNVLQQPSENLARPATYIIDEKGKIAWTDLGKRYGHRTNSGQIIAALQGL